MPRTIARLALPLTNEAEQYHLHRYATTALILFPIVTILFYVLSLLSAEMRESAIRMVQENQPVELLTFSSLVVGGVVGFLLAGRYMRQRESAVAVFWTLLSFGLLLTAMEEVAWGQTFFGFETPSFFKEHNRQGETTIHNVRGLHGHAEYLHILFGVAGVAGIWLSAHAMLGRIGVPFILLSWFLTIAAVSAVNLYDDYVAVSARFKINMRWTSEVVEMLIGMAGLLYIILKVRAPDVARLASPKRAPTVPERVAHH